MYIYVYICFYIHIYIYISVYIYRAFTVSSSQNLALTVLYAPYSLDNGMPSRPAYKGTSLARKRTP